MSDLIERPVTALEDLIGRLEGVRADWDVEDTVYTMCREAATELSRLTAEVERLRELTKTYATHGALGAMQRALRAEASEARSQTDAARWQKMRDLMTHERSGPNVGWTLGLLLSGDDPDSAIDAHD